MSILGDRLSDGAPLLGGVRRPWAYAALAVVALAVLLVSLSAAFATLRGSPDLASSSIYTWLHENPRAAYWAAPALMIVVAILPIPAEIPAAMNGMLFGAVIGVLISWSGAMVGAMMSYELARCFGRKLARRFVGDDVVDKLEPLRDTQAPVLIMLRLTPVVAFTVVNWASGLFQVRRSTFMWTTAVGILPGAIAFTASGSVLAAMYRRNPVAVTLVGALLCIVLLGRAWWKRRKAMQLAAISSSTGSTS